MSVKGRDAGSPGSVLLPRDSFELSLEFTLVADAVIVDNGLGRGTVPLAPAVFRALLVGVTVSEYQDFRCSGVFGFDF